MLIEFSVENYKSIKDKIIFSMAADDEGNQRFLKSALIYGANASGKSSLVESIALLQHIVRTSSKYTPEDRFPVVPFRLSKNSLNAPTGFNIHFIYNEIHYEYELFLKQEKVLSENLYYYQNEEKNAVFTRNDNNIELQTAVKQDPETSLRHKILKENIADNILFLSQANNINDEHIKNSFNWFSTKLFVINQLVPNPLTRMYLDEKIIDKQIVLEFLKNADPFIKDFYVKKEETNFPLGPLTPIKQMIARENNIPIDELNFTKAEVISEFFQRYSLDDDSLIEFGMEEESMGTKKYYNLLGPIILAIKNGNVIICDEFENSLHHLLVMNIFRYFMSEENKTNAQLIVTTHDVILLTEELFGNDQIWFVNKNYQAASELYSLCEIENPPSGKDLLKEYLRGTLGAVNPRL